MESNEMSRRNFLIACKCVCVCVCVVSRRSGLGEQDKP